MKSEHTDWYLVESEYAFGGNGGRILSQRANYIGKGDTILLLAAVEFFSRLLDNPENHKLDVQYFEMMAALVSFLDRVRHSERSSLKIKGPVFIGIQPLSIGCFWASCRQQAHLRL